jgi:hypothetical protein
VLGPMPGSISNSVWVAVLMLISPSKVMPPIRLVENLGPRQQADGQWRSLHAHDRHVDLHPPGRWLGQVDLAVSASAVKPRQPARRHR